MNGQMYQIASVVAASKKAMQLNEPIKYVPAKYENSIEFEFLPQMRFWGMKKYTAPNVSAWFEHIRKNQVIDVKLLCPYSVKDRALLGFSNMTESSILCFHRDGKVTYFVADWQFNSAQKNWNILYSSAVNLLDGSSEYPDKKYGLELPQIPQQNLQMFEAASMADVFGAMGSWNDSPPYMAHKKGLDKEYEILSADLLKNIRLAILYAINEW